MGPLISNICAGACVFGFVTFSSYEAFKPDPCIVEILDQTGTVLHTVQTNSKAPIVDELPKLAPGTYMYRAYCGADNISFEVKE